MKEKIKLNIKQVFDLAFQNQSKKKFDLAKKLYEKVIEIDPNIINAQFNLGIIYEELNEVENAIKCYEKTIQIDPLFIKSYNNLGLIYVDLGNYKKAIDYFILALKKNSEYENIIINLINALTHYSPNIDHPIIDADKNIKQLGNIIILDDLLDKNKLKIFFEDINKIKSKIENKILNFSNSQVFRRNSINYNCERHHDVFNKFNIIPRSCFDCFKIQIEPANVVELIKLSFIFDRFQFPNNNWRKCMIELRPSVSGTYKGLIYCNSYKEMDKILKDISPILKKYLKYKIITKRGCSEFYKSYPNYKIVDENNSDHMGYDLNWKKLEIEADLKRNSKELKLISSLSGLSLSDVLTMNQWLNYANLIEDKSYYDIGLEPSYSEFIHKKMSHQTEFRRKQFLC